jgi:hypothetical protein
MDAELGAWLRQQREDQGWNKHEMARRLIQAGRDAGDTAIPGIAGMLHNVQRWEREGGVSERHKLHYCRALTIHPRQFGPLPNDDRPDAQAPASPALTASADALIAPVPASTLASDPGVVDTYPLMPALVTYRGRQEAALGGDTVEQEVMMAAHESSDHAAEREQRGIGETTFEQLHADVVRLSRLTDSGSSLSAFLEARRVRDRVYHLLDRRLWPRAQSDLYFVLGCVNALMGVNANRLGYPDAAEELIRAGWIYSNAIDHRPLQGMLRERLSYVMYWRGRFREAHDLAVDGLRYVSQGPLGAELYVCQARAAARMGNPDTARHAVTLAHAAREGDFDNELLDIGGEFSVSLATHYAQAGAALADTGGAERDAVIELERSVSLYDRGPGPGEQHWFGGKALASTDLAVVRLKTGALDGAATILEPVLTLPPAQRVSSLTARLALVRRELAAPVFRDSPQARDLGDQIEEFDRTAVTAGLHSLSG